MKAKSVGTVISELTNHTASKEIERTRSYIGIKTFTSAIEEILASAGLDASDKIRDVAIPSRRKLGIPIWGDFVSRWREKILFLTMNEMMNKNTATK
jgi:phenylalanyl-tRNA synthetase beta subunit